MADLADTTAAKTERKTGFIFVIWSWGSLQAQLKTLG